VKDNKKANNNGNPVSLTLVFNELIDLKERVSALEAKVDMLVTQNKQLSLIMKYVVTPLIIILGALIGLKITLP